MQASTNHNDDDLDRDRPERPGRPSGRGATKWDTKRETSRQTLLASALRSFHERGYAATRITDIVSGTGYTPGAFYFHFKDKADCFWAVLEYRDSLREGWTAIAEDVTPETVSLEELLTTVFAGFAESYADTNEWALVMVDFYLQHHQDSDTPTRLTATYARWLTELEDFLRKLQNAGYIDPGRELHQLAVEVLAYFDGIISHARIYSTEPTRYTATLIDGITRLIATD